jgi:2-polyprenyl-3-methyl-5-hydroxy-6-metoxy-1,4-benzoquinol methylase
MCNQVLEHITFPLQGIKNLSYITAPGGYIWVSIPTINCIHGEPWFYSSGYHPRMLKSLGRTVGLEILHIGAWGSRKYLVAAVLGRWLTEKQLKRGFRGMWDLAFPWLALQDGRRSQVHKYITDCWVLFRKR